MGFQVCGPNARVLGDSRLPLLFAARLTRQGILSAPPGAHPDPERFFPVAPLLALVPGATSPCLSYGDEWPPTGVSDPALGPSQSVLNVVARVTLSKRDSEYVCLLPRTFEWLPDFPP